jgi:hypothetical protein
MLVACQLACLSALERHYVGVRVGAQCGGACGCAAHFFWVSANGATHCFQTDAGQLERLDQMASKSRRLAGNSKLGGNGDATSLGNPNSKGHMP